MAEKPNTNRDQRLSRTQELRAADPIHEDYDPDDDFLLSTKRIPPREGYSQRWVRTTIKGNEDQGNVQRRFNQGWRPRLRSTVPAEQYVMTVKFGESDVIGIQGSILFEIPTKLLDRKKKAIQQATKDQMKAVDTDLQKVHDKRSGLTAPEFSERKDSVRRGKSALVDD